MSWVVNANKPYNLSRLGMSRPEFNDFVRDWPRSEEGRRLLEGLRCGLGWWVLLGALCMLGRLGFSCLHAAELQVIPACACMRPACRAGSVEGWPRPPLPGEAEQSSGSRQRRSSGSRPRRCGAARRRRMVALAGRRRQPNESS